MTRTNQALAFRQLWASGSHEEAMIAATNAAHLMPENPEIAFYAGIYCQAFGNKEDARSHLIRAISLAPLIAAPYWALSKQEPLLELDGSIEALQRIIEGSSSAASLNTVTANFALARGFHDAAEYLRAASHLKAANNGKLELRPSDSDRLLRIIRHNLHEVRPADKPLRIVYPHRDSQKLVFIIGMPRSGSTLVEQIMLRSPQVKSIGECDLLQRALHQAPGKTITDKLPYIQSVYRRLLPQSVRNAELVIDKSLYNFSAIGVICKAFPNALVLHCRRRCLDNILSMYQAHFDQGSHFASSLTDAASILAAQSQLVDLYREHFGHLMHSVVYEEVVSNPPQRLKEIFDFCGVSWSEEYLDSSYTRNVILTSSVTQARNKIHTSSVGVANNYHKLLLPASQRLEELSSRSDLLG